MRRALNPVSFFFQSAITALLFVTVWMTMPVFFQHLITGKQWGVEQVVLLVAAFWCISFSIYFSTPVFYFFHGSPDHEKTSSFCNLKMAETGHKKISNMFQGQLVHDYFPAKLYVKSEQPGKAKQV